MSANLDLLNTQQQGKKAVPPDSPSIVSNMFDDADKMFSFEANADEDAKNRRKQVSDMMGQGDI